MRLAVIAVMVLSLAFGLPTARAAAEGIDVDVRGDGAGQFVGRGTVVPKKAIGHKRSAAPRKVVAAAHLGAKKPLTDAEWRALMGMCRRMNQEFSCATPKDPKKATSKVVQLDLDAVARTLVVRLQLPDPTPQIGPDPSANEWKMAAVGYPLWLWTGGPRTVTSRVRAYGITFTLRATWRSTTFDMGDGHRLTCTSAHAFTSAVKAGSRSPDCGYTYLTPSLPRGSYTVRATTNWRIAWSALGARGSLPGSYTGSRSLPVGELNALVVR